RCVRRASRDALQNPRGHVATQRICRADATLPAGPPAARNPRLHAFYTRLRSLPKVRFGNDPRHCVPLGEPTMKRLLLASLVAGRLVAADALSVAQKPAGGPPSAGGELQVQVEERNPWTNLRLNNGPDTFSFAIVSDRTGGHRARIFSQAVEQLNLLQPQFVLSVGDLIEGYTEDP